MKDRGYTWTTWKAALLDRHTSAQCEDINGIITAWFYDGDDVHTCKMWRGEVPYSVAEVYSQEQNDADVADFDATTIEFNKAIEQRNFDGRQITQPVTLGSGQWHYWHSVGDSTTTLGAGTRFGTEQSSTGDSTISWYYRDPVWIAGGLLKYKGAELGDWVRLTIYAPASTITPNPTNTGNCHLIYGVLIPSAGGNTGEYDVDLTTAIPVPTSDFEPYSGYWDYTMPTNMMGRGVITPGAVPGHAKYHLIPARMDLDGFVRDEMILGDGQCVYEPTNINVSLCLPGWEFECILHNEGGTHNVQAVWRVLVSRYWTTM